ncbi:hypothetical protein ABFB27_28425, partial [Escherichia coli]
CPEEGIKKTARYGGWSMHEINHFIVIRIEVSGASRNIHLYNRYCDSPLNHYLNHPRPEERPDSVIYNTRMMHHRPCQEIQNLHQQCTILLP